MTAEVVGLLYRGIIQHLAGNTEKAKEYARQAMEIDETFCICGGQTVPCRYNRTRARLCTECGIVWREKKAVQRCWVNSRRAG